MYRNRIYDSNIRIIWSTDNDYFGGIVIILESIVLICAFISGAAIYFAGYGYAEEYLKINISKNIFFPVFLLLTVLIGLYVAQTIHLSENTGRVSNDQQNVGIYYCWIEDSAKCNEITSAINNAAYSDVQSGKIKQGDFYIPLSFSDLVKKNALSYFCSGMMSIWCIMFLYGVVRKNEGSN
jgi:hypothetical protein